MSIISKLPKFIEETAIIAQARLSRGGMGVLVTTYMPLVETTARRWKGKTKTSIPIDDLCQEGLLGLMRAAALYDPARGVKFTTWAICCIESSVRSNIRREKKYGATFSVTLDEDLYDQLHSYFSQRLVEQETLSSIASVVRISNFMTKREFELIHIRYNLEVH